ncbi:MAG: glycosyltransferase family 4 protein [Candidatus Omnitrophota bacterium]
MKVLFIVPYPTEGPSNRFRVEQYLPTLKERGINFSVRPFYSSNFRKILLKKGRYLQKILYLVFFTVLRLADVFKCRNYEIVFIHREAFPTNDCIFEWLFGKLSKKLIYDFDDSIFLTKPSKVKKIIALSDFVIAGNGFLKEYALKLNKNVEVLHTCIDTDRYKPAIRFRDNKKTVIGWMGSPTTAKYLSEIKEVFRILSQKYHNVEYRVIGARFDKSADVSLVNKDWVLNSEVTELQHFDIGLMPMPDDEWTRGKCAFKIIQYMAVGIPAVASPVGMNAEVIQDGVNGFLASGIEEWCEKLSRLIESLPLRQRLGAEGRRTAERNYSLNVNAPKFLKILENCVKGV